MNEVTVNKDKLIGILEKNLEQHKIDFETAVDGYYIEAVEQLENALKIAKGKGDVPYVTLTQPTSHEDEYLRTIGMLKLHVSDRIEITAQDYSSYVDDNWDWKHHWKSSNTMYMSKGG